MKLGSFIATIVFLKAFFMSNAYRTIGGKKLTLFIETLTKIMNFFSRYHNIPVEEYVGERFSRSEANTIIESYLSEKTSEKAGDLKASFVEDGKALMLGLDNNQEVTRADQMVQAHWLYPARPTILKGLDL
ncbi:AAA-ATPase At3g28580-like [Silene latifolia]|uniref:AAA-ATPase At3g28580-like n=1 Tax=Silene latifolia TaxID=37657 RepID=UPI003D776461